MLSRTDKPWVFLSGMMGVGKSSAGAALAQKLGSPFVDLDARIEARAGKAARDIFAEQGEAAFRRIEVAEMGRLLDGSEASVVALGGGTVTDRALRRRLLEAGVLVTLRASPAEVARRMQPGELAQRPLLCAGDVEDIVARLMEQRADAYAECHGAIDTDGRPVSEVVDAVQALLDCPPLPVPLGRRTYHVEVGRGIRARLPERLSPGRVVLVTDEHVKRHWDSNDWGSPVALPEPPVTVVLKPGEAHKTIAAVERIWDAALDAGVDRGATVVALGGGVVGDLAGFAGSTLLRGVGFGQVPTSLLAMVDSSVGGKTGFDRRQGKNLVGTFQQPAFVLCDLETLRTLPQEELVAGLAEVVKSAWLAGEPAVAALEAAAEALLERDLDALADCVRMSITLKARIVAEDEREAGQRALLNLGHTLGHAIEAAQGYVGIRHGEAVSLGMVAAFRLAEVLGQRKLGQLERLTRLLERLGLPVNLEPYLVDKTFAFLASDKKRAGSRVKFIVPGEPGQTAIVPLSPDEIRRNLMSWPLPS